LTTHIKSNIKMMNFIKFFFSLTIFENLQYLSTKEGNLFDLFVTLKFPNHGVSCHAFGVVGKFLMNKGVSSWFHNVSTYNEVIENKFS